MKVDLQQHKPNEDEYHLEFGFDGNRHVNFCSSECGKDITIFNCTKAELGQLILDLGSLLAQININPDLTLKVIHPATEVK